MHIASNLFPPFLSSSADEEDDGNPFAELEEDEDELSQRERNFMEDC